MPVIRQAIVTCNPKIKDQEAFERKILTIRKQTLNSVRALAERRKEPTVVNFYMPSFSSRTVVYKGLLLANQVESFYDDLRNPLCESALALVHQRFSTNTFPSWRLAHPYRFLAHNGEINTVRGNVNWMYARRHSMASDLIGPDLDKMWPLIPHGQSDTACIDNALELLVAGGYSLAQAMMMLIPEAWAGNPLMDPKRRAFYEYYAALMEPWDGPAAIAFTDGRQIGATLDRNGLRPARYVITDDDHVIMASEVGVLPVPEERIVHKWRLQPGRMLLIDLEQGRIISDSEIKQQLADEHPYEEWLKETQVQLEELPEIPSAEVHTLRNDPSDLMSQQQAFGYTQEDLQFFLEPMGADGDDPIGSMGTDTPLAVLSKKPKLLYNYFKQNFAQVTNPPIDPIREELVMSLVSMIGPRPNLLGHHAGTHYRLEVNQPILTNADLEKIRSISTLVGEAFRTCTLDATWPAAEGPDGMARAIDRLCAEATNAVVEGYNILILSDRATAPTASPIPALLATASVHHHLIRQGLRTSTGLVVETGEARQVHHFCVLAGLRRRGDQPLPRLRDAGAHPHRERARARHARRPEELHQGVRQGHPEGDVQDGHLHLPVLLRRADLRRGRARHRFRREVLHRHRLDHRGRRPRRDRGRGDGAPPRTPTATTRSIDGDARRRRRLRVPPARRGPCLDAGDGGALCSTRCAATCPTSTDIRAVDQRPVGAAADPARADAVQAGGRRPCRSTRSSRRRRSSSASPPAR